MGRIKTAGERSFAPDDEASKAAVTQSAAGVSTSAAPEASKDAAAQAQTPGMLRTSQQIAAQRAQWVEDAEKVELPKTGNETIEFLRKISAEPVRTRDE